MGNVSSVLAKLKPKMNHHFLAVFGYPLVVGCLVLGASVHRPNDFVLPSIESDNEVIDMIIDTVKELMVKENVEPIALPDNKTSADYGPIEFAIEMNHGQMTGLTTLARTGDSTIQYNHTEGHTAKINARLGLQHVNITYHMNFEASIASVSCEMSATSSDMFIDMVASFCLDGSCKAEVESMNIKDVHYDIHISVNVPGHEWIVDWIVDWVESLFTNSVFKDQINETVEVQLE